MKILLVCNAGMSTGIMKMKLEQEAKTRGLDASVDAIPMVELGDNLEGTSVILLGPQIRFALDDIKKQAAKRSYQGIETIIRALETAKVRISANVNFDLVIELLLLTIKEN